MGSGSCFCERQSAACSVIVYNTLHCLSAVRTGQNLLGMRKHKSLDDTKVFCFLSCKTIVVDYWILRTTPLHFHCRVPRLACVVQTVSMHSANRTYTRQGAVISLSRHSHNSNISATTANWKCGRAKAFALSTKANRIIAKKRERRSLRTEMKGRS